MTNEPVWFSPNVPQIVQLLTCKPEPVADQFGYRLKDGRLLLVEADLALSIAALKPQPGEEIGICMKWDARPESAVEWSVWLTPKTERERGRKEAEDSGDGPLALQLRKSIEHARRKPAAREISPPIETRGNGTYGPAPAVAVEPARPGPPKRLPYRVALQQCVDAVTSVLKASGEQWNDAAKQDLASTVFIAMVNARIVEFWGEEAA